MSRLIAFGCSLTYGTGLNNKEQEAWPVVLGKLSHKEVVNCGVPGYSNKQIYFEVLKYNYVPGDTVVVSWSHNPRFTILSNYNNIDDNTTFWPMSTNNSDGSDIYFSKIQNDTDDLITNYAYMNHVHLYLTSLNCNLIQLIQIPKFDWRSTKLPIDNWNNIVHNIPDVHMSILRKSYGTGNDGWHPNAECHKKYAELIYEWRR